ncbi:MAG: respiratory nitrate reductase subunit gamma [Rhodospirillales bacterium]|nr:respiratory nitrate reductase subunit gamma [Rhodospirillales bacterium]
MASSGVSAFYAVLFYAATAIFLGGLAWKIRQYWRTPSPLKIAVTPAPVSAPGAALRVAREVVLFESLFFSSRWLWIMAALFHAGLALALLRHLRYFQDPVWELVALAQPFGIYGGLAMLGGLLMLLGRRLVIDRVRFVTAPSDLLMLLLLIGIGLSGFGMSAMARVDVVMVKAFFRGLLVLQIRPLPIDPPLLLHLAAVAALMILFPFSKLLHLPGIFFSPTRHQADNPREARHLAPWAAKLEEKS